MPAILKTGELFRTQRLRLRWMESIDFSNLFSLLSDPLVMKHYPKTLDENETRVWMDKTFAGYEKYGHGFYIVEELRSGRFIGQVGLLPQILEGEYQPELGYLIRSEVFGNGFATEAGRACLAFGFEILGFEKVVSLIRSDNTRSIAVAKRLGLALEKEIDWKGFRTLIHSIAKSKYVRVRETEPPKFDASLVAHNLTLLPEERLASHENARELIRDLQEAGRKYYAGQSETFT
ncbi:MAG: GNAT family N-acetyltransferase [Deltaproteobacteria bacterium]|nr:GNAT family N-acetyltransferase [Deltaproteobacteria bacterium]MBI3295984.1 GNAT family N-acetyltransferase [Deltaproteobacteria bacterium]